MGESTENTDFNSLGSNTLIIDHLNTKEMN